MVDDILNFFLDTSTGCGCALFVLLIILGGAGYGLYSAHQNDKRAYHHFMEACTKEHKEYVCEVTWRNANKSDNTAIVPMPIVIPTR
jgi:hypothetical protein